jgi:hypothetical protein
MKRCKKPSLDQFTGPQMLMLHKVEMIARRKRQRERLPDLDSRLVHFSKNSLPEYRKN